MLSLKQPESTTYTLKQHLHECYQEGIRWGPTFLTLTKRNKQK